MDMHPLMSSGLSTNEGKISGVNAEAVGQEENQLLVGPAVGGRRVQADLQGVSVWTMNSATGGTGDGVQCENAAHSVVGNPTHGNSMASTIPKIK